MTRKMEYPLLDHIAQWQHCCECELHKSRFKTVLMRGQFPCEILFIGEAPGPSEDVVGKAFVGPAGHLLDQMLQEAVEKVGTRKSIKFCITNVIACYPGRDAQDNFNRPTKEQVEACRPRLENIMANSRAHTIITLGSVPKANLPSLPENVKHTHSLIHPSAILHISNKNKQEIEYIRFVNYLTRILKTKG